MNRSAPRAVGELLVNAVPQLEDRLLVERLRRTWGALVGRGGGPPRAAAGAQQRVPAHRGRQLPVAARIDAAGPRAHRRACTRRFPRSIRFASAWARHRWKTRHHLPARPRGGRDSPKTTHARSTRPPLRSPIRLSPTPPAGCWPGRGAPGPEVRNDDVWLRRRSPAATGRRACRVRHRRCRTGCRRRRAAAAILARQRHVGRGVLPVLGGADAGAGRPLQGRGGADAGSHQARPGLRLPVGSARAVAGPRRSAGRGAHRRPACGAALARATSQGHLTLAELYRTPEELARGRGRAGERSSSSTPTPRSPTSRSPATWWSRRPTTGRARSCCGWSTGSPRTSQAQFLLGRLAIETESWDEAITRLTRAVELDPDHDGAWTALGYVYESQRRTDEAIEVYRKAVKANPGQPGVRRAAGRPADPHRALQGCAARGRGADRAGAARPPRVDEDGRRVLRAEAVRPGQRGLPPGGAAGAVESPGPLLPGHDLHGRRPRRRCPGGAGADPRGPIPARSTPACSSAFLHSKAKQYDEAVALLREAINIDPRRPDLFLYLGHRPLPRPRSTTGPSRRCRRG